MLTPLFESKCSTSAFWENSNEVKFRLRKMESWARRPPCLDRGIQVDLDDALDVGFERSKSDLWK